MRQAFLVVALCGCASAGTSEETTARQPPIFESKETGTLLGEQPHPVTVTIAAPPVAVWLALKEVYADLEIPVTVENPSTHQIGNPSFHKTRVLGGQPMEGFIDCGSGMSGPKAATYRIYISLLTTVVGDDNGGTKVQTMLIPVGQDISGTSSDRIHCGSSGRFEKFFLDAVNAKIRKG